MRPAQLNSEGDVMHTFHPPDSGIVHKWMFIKNDLAGADTIGRAHQNVGVADSMHRLP